MNFDKAGKCRYCGSEVIACRKDEVAECGLYRILLRKIRNARPGEIMPCGHDTLKENPTMPTMPEDKTLTKHPTIVVCGPQGCGKTRSRDKLRRAFGCRQAVDDWLPVQPLTPGALHLTSVPKQEVSAVFPNVRVVDFAEAMRQIVQRPSEADAAGPDYYHATDIQPWAAMEAWLTHEEFVGFLRGTILKYHARALHKGQRAADLRKAAHYARKLEEILTKEEPSDGRG